jgi:predicted  nucleic acid-binding Zn-ribbon protein
MARQEELFLKPELTISVHDPRREPPLWVRRVVLWAQPGEQIRDVSFRRGLNVIWSPDPGSGAANVGQNADSGHGAGKTLFCRLLRYCLGEATFASEDQRRTIAAKFPNGLVGAEILIGGTVWAVIRPIGQTRRHIVRREGRLEDLAESKEAATGIAPLLEALSSVVCPPTLDGIVPELRGDSAWLFALAWLGRDQENRFDHILDWRHARSESGSPVSSLSKDQVLAGVRALLGILDDDEIRIKNDRQRIPSKRQNADRDLAYLRRRIEELRAELLRRVELAQDGALGGPLDLATLQSLAEARLRTCLEKESSRPFAAKIREARTERDRVLQESAVVDEQIKKLDAKVELTKQQMQGLQGERTDLKVKELRETHGDLCPICFVPIDLALADGCTLSTKRRDSQSVAGEKAELASRIGGCQTTLDHYSAEAKDARVRLSTLRARKEALDAQVADLENLAEQHHDACRRQSSDARRFQDDVGEFADLQDKLSKAEGAILALDDREKELRDQQSALRDRHADVMRRFNDLYVFVSRALLGSDVESAIDLTGQGLQARVQVGGQAMESLKTLVFDIAAMLMSIEGRAGVPAFLIHDSPREADLGESIYHRLFRFAASLESLSEQPPFQYIVTTTSDPPPEIRSSDCLVQKLSGSLVNDRLLRCDLGQ